MNGIKIVRVILKGLKMLFRENKRKSDVVVTAENNVQHPGDNPIVKKEHHIGNCYNYETKCMEKAYKIPFITGPDGAIIYIGFDFEYVKILCYSRRTVSAPEYDDSGSAYYDFPMNESLDYLNVIAFIREKTYLGENLGGHLISREEYEAILSDIGYKE